MAGYGNFTSQQNQTPTEKISAAASPSATSASSKSFAGALSDKLVAVGASIGAVASKVSTGLDGVTSSLRGDTTQLTQSTLTRVSPTDLINNRKSYSGNGEKFASSHMPSRKIDTAKVDQKSADIIIYPPDMRKYYINFLFGDYERPNPYKESTFKSTLQIALPMPGSLLSPQGVKLNPTELGGVLGGATENVAAIVQDLAAGGFNKPTKDVSGAFKSAANQTVGAAYNTVYELAGAIPGLDNVAGVAGQLFGAVPNPHITVFFQGVDLRAHSFTWRFAPKNVDESILVQKIIKEFKKRMLPNYKWGAANVLGYPQMVQITLEPDLSEQLYKFKQCMISSVNVNYAPNGVPSFFAGTQYPTVIEFQVNLQELEIFTSQDYGGKNGDAVGSISDALQSDTVSAKS